MGRILHRPGILLGIGAVLSALAAPEWQMRPTATGWTAGTDQEANDMRGMPPGRIAGPGELFLYSFLCHLTLKGDGKPHTFRLRLSEEMKTNNRPFSAGRLRGELRFFYRGRPAFGQPASAPLCDRARVLEYPHLLFGEGPAEKKVLFRRTLLPYYGIGADIPPRRLRQDETRYPFPSGHPVFHGRAVFCRFFVILLLLYCYT